MKVKFTLNIIVIFKIIDEYSLFENMLALTHLEIVSYEYIPLKDSFGSADLKYSAYIEKNYV